MAASSDKTNTYEWMTALSFRTQTGSLSQTEVNAADLFNLFSAAHSPYGWLGGLDGAKFLLSNFSNTVSTRIKELQLDRNLRLSPIRALVFTAAGPLTCSVDNAHEAFGGDVRTQLIGLTLCALAHEMSELNAVALFGACMIPELFQGSDEIAQALYSQLNDEFHIRQILNEGAVRGLTQLFTSVTASLNLPEGDRQWLRHHLLTDNEDVVRLPSEVQMVGGLLRWIMSSDSNTYATRSALVARVAACLRSIGYPIGVIEAWVGTGNYPQNLGPRAVLLVLGGSSPTDPLMFDADEIAEHARTLHYHYKSVGAMLLSTLGSQLDVYPEVLQAHFEFIYQYFERQLLVEYELTKPPLRDLQAKFRWALPLTRSTSIARRIAKIYFPSSAEFIAPCYTRIASKELLSQLKEQDRFIGGYDIIPEAVCLFRAVTAAIVISIVAMFDKEGFKKTQHSISLILTESSWLRWFCDLVDQALISGLEYEKAVCALAVIHCAQDPETIIRKRRSPPIIAWRSGIYSVIPSLIQSMRPTPDAVVLQYIDSYWANVHVREDGSIHSSATSIKLDTDPLDLIEDMEAKDFTDETHNETPSPLQSLSRDCLSEAQCGPPDVPLSLTIERPLHINDASLCLVGRVGGSVIGSPGILNVLRGLVRNLDEPHDCPGHTSTSTVINVKASVWAENYRSKLVGENPTFIPVQGDKCWAVFLVGDSTYCNGCIALRCPQCTVERAGPRSVIVGYC